MTDQGAGAGEAKNNEAEAKAADEATVAETAGDAETQGDPLEALAKEAGEFRDRWMRAMAEMENLRRRTEREVADARSYGIAGFARDMVGVADNMRRALDALPSELRESAEAGVKALVEGIELTDRELAKALEKHGVRKLEAEGRKFDPNLHQAMFEVPDPSQPSGTIVQVMQDGYVIGERVLRPALVGVAKGGPKADAKASAANAPAENGKADGNAPTDKTA